MPKVCSGSGRFKGSKQLECAYLMRRLKEFLQNPAMMLCNPIACYDMSMFVTCCLCK